MRVISQFWCAEAELQFPGNHAQCPTCNSFRGIFITKYLRVNKKY